MPEFYTESGKVVHLGRKLGTGGEGSAFDLGDNTVAKIYHKAPGIERVEKLHAMVSRCNPDLLRVAAWPKQVLFDRNRRVVGFTMPLVDGYKEVIKLYTPVTRKHTFPNADFQFLVYAARNVAIAVSEVHRANAVVGDLNERNVLVGNDARVVLIDCDSFQVTAGGRTYRCPVGVVNYTAPELQGKSFDSIDRTHESDQFALAVMLFQLLCLARYPFVTALSDGTEISLERAISEYKFAWAPDAANRRVSPPQRSIALSALGELGQLFTSAFTQGTRRPTASEWVDALHRTASTLMRCSKSPGHLYPKSATQCPWCALISQGVNDPFITITLRTASLTSWPTNANPDALIQLVATLPQPETLGSVLSRHPFIGTPRPWTAPPPIGPLLKAASDVPLGIAFVLCVVTALIPARRAWGCPVGGVATLAWLGFATTRHRAVVRQAQGIEARRVLIQAEYQSRWQILQSAQAAYNEAVGKVAEHDGAMEENRNRLVQKLREAKREMELLANSLPSRLSRMQAQIVNLQLQDYLEQFDIEDAQIKGFPRTLKKTLKNYSIFTAADIEWNKLFGIPGVGDGRRDQLLNWRTEVERGFRPDATKGLTPQHRQQAILEISQERTQLARQIEQSVAAFRSQHERAMQTALQLRAAAVHAHNAAQQAQIDLGVVPPA